ncbi:hypothetical protein BDF20DRAFT_861283 [Mycotypha africana]|uniref:uncharacterized protein n=1 Tax=Mycotypha africana TaxID=64632 RepID=UPI002300E968|nr:uncharacterized protein BDF20DRAFT_861283 [Mycotypha africana]KAI8984701.1 hypothetical protein BDF20DRAFT_861283 [Mycotypha africana]
MFNPQPHKPAFKFVIHSKIEQENSGEGTERKDDGFKSAEIDKKQSSTKEFVEEQKVTSSLVTETTSETSTKTTSTTIATSTNSASDTVEPSAAQNASATTDNRKRKRSDKETALPGSIAPLTTKKIHSHLERWNRKKEELKHEREIEEQAIKNYADLSAMACLLCQRKFKSQADLERHQELSELHKTNLNDPVAVNKAKLKLQFLKSDSEEKEPSMQYRNRAAERRQTYGQPDKPVIPSSRPGGYKQPVAPREIEAIQQASMHVPISDSNKGAQMLQKMGWKKGEGLGKHGTGIVDPIKAESYAQQTASSQPPSRR